MDRRRTHECREAREALVRRLVMRHRKRYDTVAKQKSGLMRIPMTLVVAVASGAVTADGIAAEPPAPLAPASKWQMDYAPAECRLLRTFAEGKDKTTLQLGRLDVSDVLEMALAGQHMPATDGDVAVSVSTSTVPRFRVCVLVVSPLPAERPEVSASGRTRTLQALCAAMSQPPSLLGWA